MVKSYRLVLQGRKGRHVEHFGAPEIKADSIVHISASEVVIAPPPVIAVHSPGQTASGDVLSRVRDRIIGAADVAVMNVAPSEGRVDFVLSVDWSQPLVIVVDITIFDAPAQTVLG